MKSFNLPFIHLPSEFTTLLKSNLAVTTSPEPIFVDIRKNRALYTLLEVAFKEFDDGRGLEKLMLALGWSNFRERLASLYIYRSVYGTFPSSTNMELVEDLKHLESRFTDHSVHSYSRVFLLGFYLKLAQIQMQKENKYLELLVPDEIAPLMRLSQGRSEKADWLILTLWHFSQEFGSKMLINLLTSGKKFEDVYYLMPVEARERMCNNLLAYGASIGEKDVFLYEKI